MDGELAFNRQYPNSKSFPHKLYILLLNVPPDIAGWAPDGRSFRIVDQQRFSTLVLPRFFAHDKMASFKRQLNIYGFRSIRTAAAARESTESVQRNDGGEWAKQRSVDIFGGDLLMWVESRR